MRKCNRNTWHPIPGMRSTTTPSTRNQHFLLTRPLGNSRATSRTPPPIAAIIALPALGLLLLYAANDLPAFGDPASPASVHVSPYYLENSLAETQTPNVVTAVIMDYRALDTLMETTVIFTAGIACWLVLRRKVA